MQNRAFVVNVSYYGAVSYHLDPAYGATKAGLDKLTFDMAQDFKPYSVAVVSIWPGTTAAEQAKPVLAKIPGGGKILESAETPKFSGLAIASLYSDPQRMSKSGSVVIAAEAAPDSRISMRQAASQLSRTEGLSAPVLDGITEPQIWERSWGESDQSC